MPLIGKLHSLKDWLKETKVYSLSDNAQTTQHRWFLLSLERLDYTTFVSSFYRSLDDRQKAISS